MLWLDPRSLSLLAAALALAWAWDLLFGEPANRWHPVAWLGRGAQRLGRRLPGLAARPARWAGALAWAALTGGATALAWAAQTALPKLPAWAAVTLLAIALKPAFAWRMLHDEVAAVEHELQRAGTSAGRERVARLCSREVGTLDEAGVRETAVETLAENLNDSLVAPLWWLVLLGLPGAWAWRAVNTLDAMWGHRGRWEHAGATAARADDLLAWAPARLTAALLWRPGVAPAVLRREAGRTPSPNGGWPMAAMALGLGVRLRKPGVYTLNADAPAPDTRSMALALRRATVAAWTAAALALAALLAAAGWPGVGAAAPW